MMEAIPRGKKRDAALAALKESGDLTEEACTAAGRSDGARAGGRAHHCNGWTAAEDYIIQCGAKFGWTLQRIAVHLPNRSANAAASRNRHHRLKESARDGPPAEAVEGEAAASAVFMDYSCPLAELGELGELGELAELSELAELAEQAELAELVGELAELVELGEWADEWAAGASGREWAAAVN